MIFLILTDSVGNLLTVWILVFQSRWDFERQKTYYAKIVYHCDLGIFHFSVYTFPEGKIKSLRLNSSDCMLLELIRKVFIPKKV